MQIKNRPIYFIGSIVILSIVISGLVIYHTFAWTNPGSNPPIASSAITASGGNVGVGTAAPAYKLDVNGDINLTGTLRQNGAVFSSGLGGAGTANYISKWTSGAALGNSQVTDDGTTVGIPNILSVSGSGSNFGTTGTCCATQTPTLGISELTSSNNRLPWLQFHAGGYQESFIRLAKDTRVFEMGDSQGAGTDLALLNGSGTRNVYLSPRNNSYFLGGNVGIGTATPGDKLEINGNLRFTTANPYINASSYFIAPGGAYFNGGTVYAESPIQARGGLHNDTGPYLALQGGTTGKTLLSGALRFPDGTEQTTAAPVSRFGGVFVTGIPVNNPQTGALSCPAGYTTVHIASLGASDSYLCQN